MPEAGVAYSANPVAYGGYDQIGIHFAPSSARLTSIGGEADEVEYFAFDPSNLTSNDVAALKQGKLPLELFFTTSTSDPFDYHTINVLAQTFAPTLQDAIVFDTGSLSGSTQSTVYKALVQSTGATYTASYPGISVKASFGPAYPSRNQNVVQGDNVSSDVLQAYDSGSDLIFSFYETSGGVSNVSDVFIGGIGVANVPCYCRGTAILTDHGEVAVEALEIGQCVITLNGDARAIRWIGQRHYRGRFLAGKRHLLPVVIAAGALGGGLPRRQLRVSPMHAMFLDGVLVPAHCLLNETTIRQDTACRAVDYFHLELDRHDVIFAEGAPSETFLDDGSRGLFQNATDIHSMADAPRGAGYCAPRVEQGYELEAIRDRIAA